MSDKDEDLVETELGRAQDLTMDEGLRNIVAQMFEHDNDTCYLEILLEGTSAEVDPKMVLKLQLVSINDVKTRPEEED